MFAISNAFMSQAEVVQPDRWDYGPLELILIDDDRSGYEQELCIVDWNRTASGGFVRPPKSIDFMDRRLPGVRESGNPNIIIVPRGRRGYTELHSMLASVVPRNVLQQFGIEKLRSNMSLVLFHERQVIPQYADRACQAFEKYIWSKLSPRTRLRADFFDRRSPLRLLAGDAFFWMNRLYRIALERQEEFPEVVDSSEEKWRSLQELENELKHDMDPDHQPKFHVRRPLMGGDLWDVNDTDECESVVDDMIDGGGVMDSLHPVIEALHGHRVHEDFSDRYSWIKEDFERSFYSKRVKLKVSMIETVDEMPVWAAGEHEGYERVLFRDLLAFLNPKERHLLLAVRSGKTNSEIARELGHAGHAAVSRRVKQLRKKVKALLN